jgi:hypothetical protein
MQNGKEGCHDNLKALVVVLSICCTAIVVICLHQKGFRFWGRAFSVLFAWFLKDE